MATPQALRRTLRLYQPHARQLQFHNDRSRYRVVAFGRQAGKSTACINELLRRAWLSPGTRYWFVSPSFAQARQQYRRMVGMLASCWGILLKKNQTELRIKLVNQSEIKFVSGEVFDNLRGETLHGVVVDEAGDQKPGLWSLVLRPMLLTTGGWVAFIGTPKGFNEFYDLAERAKIDREWSFLTAPSWCNPLITMEEIERLRGDMSEPEFDQEINAQFRDLQAGKAYMMFTSENIKDDGVIGDLFGGFYSKHLPIVVAPDFNLSPMAWGIGQFRKGLDLWHWTDEIRLEGSHTQEASQVLVEKLKPFQNEIWVCGDATSKAGQRAAAGQSDYDIMIRALKDAGRKVHNFTPESNPTVRDRVNTMNAFFQNARGERKQYVHSRCKFMIRDFQRVLWKDGGYVLNEGEKKDLTHSSDGPGYAVHNFTPLKGVSEVGKPVVLTRNA